MRPKFETTKCLVKLQKSKRREGEYYLEIEAYPVHNQGKVERRFFAVGRIITTPIWDKSRPTRSGKFQPKRNKEGVIQCTSTADQKNCNFAQKMCQKLQDEFDRHALFPEQYKEKQIAKQKADQCFIEYLDKLIQRRRPTVGDSTHQQWLTMQKLVKTFADEKTVRFGDINALWCNQFREYLLSATVRYSNEKKLSPNSQKLYLTHFKSALNCAYKDEIIPTDISLKIEHIKGIDTQRNYLTKDELQKLADTPCRCNNTKRLSIFSALTGLRFSDIIKLTWGEITGTPAEPRLEFRQKKTKGMNYIPIPKQALQLCGQRGQDNSLVFPQKITTVTLRTIIAEWVKAAGINKKITFHCFRHSYATQQLASGTDLYTVSKMLGHKDIKTTQIYAQIIDKTKEKAAKAINLKIS